MPSAPSHSLPAPPLTSRGYPSHPHPSHSYQSPLYSHPHSHAHSHLPVGLKGDIHLPHSHSSTPNHNFNPNNSVSLSQLAHYPQSPDITNQRLAVPHLSHHPSPSPSPFHYAHLPPDSPAAASAAFAGDHLALSSPARSARSRRAAAEEGSSSRGSDHNASMDNLISSRTTTEGF